MGACTIIALGASYVAEFALVKQRQRVNTHPLDSVSNLLFVSPAIQVPPGKN